MRLDYSLNEHRNDHKVFILKILYQSPDADTFRQSAIITAQNLLLHKVPLYQSYFIFFAYLMKSMHCIEVQNPIDDQLFKHMKAYFHLRQRRAK